MFTNLAAYRDHRFVWQTQGVCLAQRGREGSRGPGNVCRGAFLALGAAPLARQGFFVHTNSSFLRSVYTSHLGCRTCEHRHPCSLSSCPHTLGRSAPSYHPILQTALLPPSHLPSHPLPPQVHTHPYPPMVPICSTVFPASNGRTSSPRIASRMVAASLSVSSRMSLPRAASARVAQGVTPASARAAALSWVRFHARTSAPWDARRRAILLPAGRGRGGGEEGRCGKGGIWEGVQVWGRGVVRGRRVGAVGPERDGSSKGGGGWGGKMVDGGGVSAGAGKRGRKAQRAVDAQPSTAARFAYDMKFESGLCLTACRGRQSSVVRSRYNKRVEVDRPLKQFPPIRPTPMTETVDLMARSSATRVAALLGFVAAAIAIDLPG